jgi:AGCS family alanine or glycine:cation symporter
MSGGPMYTMKKAFKHKKLGAILGWMFALFAVLASFGIGNLTQANSISSAVNETFNIPTWVVGIVVTILALFIIVGGIESISKVSSIVVPGMAVFYVISGLIVIVFNFQNIPAGIVLILKSAVSFKAVSGGALGTIIASFGKSMRYGVARGVFSNEAGMGSAAITAAAATTDNPVRQAYINMTGTFWDTIVVCSITGLCIAASGVLGTTHVTQHNTYYYDETCENITLTSEDNNGKTVNTTYSVVIGEDKVSLTSEDGKTTYQLTAATQNDITKTDNENYPACDGVVYEGKMVGAWVDADKNIFKFNDGDSTYTYEKLYIGSALTIQAFSSVMGKLGSWLITIGIALFAFSTIIGWEYHGEKAFEYLLGTHKFNMVYRIVFSLIVYVGATTALDIVWNLSDIANALMIVPNLICLLVLSGEIVKDMQEFQSVIKGEKKQ